MKLALTSILLTASVLPAACNKSVTYGKKKAQEKPSAPAAPPSVADVQPKEPEKPVVPDTKLSLTINRVNSLSWWKVCLEAWVVEFPNSRKAVGCNTDENAAQQTLELDGSTRQCNTLALSFTVFKNKEPCTADARSCSHQNEPSHIRSTSNPDDQKFFKAASVFGLTFPFARDDLKAIVIPEASQAEYAGFANLTGSAGENRFRVFFEDQVETTYAAWQAGGDARKNGIDFFDYVIELQSISAPVALEGNSAIACAQPPAEKSETQPPATQP